MNKHNERAELMRLADEYARAEAKAQLESLYGTSKSYTRECTREAHEAREKFAAMLEAQPAEQAKGREAVENEADDLLRRLGLDPEQYRTDGGYINHLKVKAAIRHPEDYPRIDQCQHEFVHSADLGGRVCKLCGSPERNGYTTPPAQPAREWVGWSEADILLLREVFGISPENARAIESRLREKNAGLPAAVPDDIPAILKKQAS